MTDKELLELAAKAYFPDCPRISYPLDWVRDCYGNWNPLTDDGDALRLAVKLKINMQHSTDTNLNPSLDCGRWSGATEIVHEWAEEPLGDDPYAATRRAIVRAAAEIGKTLG